MAKEAWIEAMPGGGGLAFAAGGNWLVSAASSLDRQLGAIERAPARPPEGSRGGRPREAAAGARIDCSRLEALDTVGAWLMLRLKAALAGRGGEVALDNLPERFTPLLAQAEKYRPAPPPPGVRPFGLIDTLAALGRWAIAEMRDVGNGLNFLGEVTVVGLRTLAEPRRIRPKAFLHHIQRTGPSAVPIIGLLSFLIGVVFAYQGAAQLRQFGAEIFTVNLLGIAFVRELGVLLSAIIVAGRSGSAFTAEIGTMQVNEEVDAMTTIGLDPIEVLVLPRLGALLVTLPLLTFFSIFMGLLGGAAICYFSLGIPLPLFIAQLNQAVSGQEFWLGMLKAPFFAAVIALVGCRDGLRVSRSAESVGRMTTLSVVESIFLVIVLDAVFSIIFAQFNL
ncbi:MAG TPA: MlaE family lipid ABC transporter permease subunit [Stellaceae bacterium]|nr:MlaE family lipid ABC transporter permease subunit [Stellaceae bacterium]